jgi:protein-disulfide isomerase
MAKSSDTKIDESVNADVAMGNRDNLRQTPTIVIIAKGKREVIAGALPFSILKSYIDKKLAQ